MGDYAEYIVARTFDGTLENNSAKSFDIRISDGKTYQVKARRMRGVSGDRQLSIIRSWEFDFLIGILFDENLNLKRAAKVPMSLVKGNSTRKKSTNGWTFYLRDEVWDWDSVEDVTTLLQSTHRKLLDN